MNTFSFHILDGIQELEQNPFKMKSNKTPEYENLKKSGKVCDIVLSTTLNHEPSVRLITPCLPLINLTPGGIANFVSTLRDVDGRMREAWAAYRDKLEHGSATCKPMDAILRQTFFASRIELAPRFVALEPGIPIKVTEVVVIRGDGSREVTPVPERRDKDQATKSQPREFMLVMAIRVTGPPIENCRAQTPVEHRVYCAALSEKTHLALWHYLNILPGLFRKVKGEK